MTGLAMLFMLFFWMFIIALVTFCVTLVLFNPGSEGRSLDDLDEVSEEWKT